ncbi:hypothetical protein ACERIT_03790 [Halopenitus sp. H-Gu1]|uniref:hypothetical protein n=1 Tax=Halopenitus sp. H-Gu1 TaxID=3242697 RepID=UPI00359E6E78
MATRSSMSGLVSDYSHLRTLPALLSVVFALASLYQFGGISDVHLTWFNYTLTTQHAMLTSVGVYALAFASSETKAFDRYDDWEKVLIAAGPTLIIGYEYVGFIANLVNTTSNTGPIAAFLVAVVAWSVAVR